MLRVATCTLVLGCGETGADVSPPGGVTGVTIACPEVGGGLSTFASASADEVQRVEAKVSRAIVAPVALYRTHLRQNSDPYALPDLTRPGVVTRLTLELEEIGPGAVSFQGCDGRMVSVPATLRATTDDGLIAGTFTGSFSAQADGTGAVTFSSTYDSPRTTTAAFEATLRRFGASVDDAIQVLDVTFSETGFEGELKLHSAPDRQLPFVLSRFAAFASHSPGVTWIEPSIAEPLTGVCERALAAADRTPFTVDPAAPTALDTWVERLSGRWALCGGVATMPANHAGLVLSREGVWNHLAADGGELVELLGRDHEGWLSPVVLSRAAADEVKLHLVGLAEPLSEQDFTATLSRDLTVMTLSGGATEGSIDAINYVYVAIHDQSIAKAVPARAPGERAGEAGCDEASAGLAPPAASASELDAQLPGAWSLCGTRLDPGATSVRFDPATRRYELRREDGSVVRSGDYGAISGDAVLLALDGAPNASYHRYLDGVMVFESPKLLQFWLTDPETGELERRVMSALP